jgi:hypothetical protein
VLFVGEIIANMSVISPLFAHSECFIAFVSKVSRAVVRSVRGVVDGVTFSKVDARSVKSGGVNGCGGRYTVW